MRNFNKAIFVVSAALCLNLSVFSQNVSFSVQNVTVKEAMEQLKKSSGYSFVFSSSDVDTSKKFQSQVRTLPFRILLNRFFKGRMNWTMKFKGKRLL